MKKREVTFQSVPVGTDTVELAIADWQAAGVLEIWRAMQEMTVLSYALRGVDVRGRPMDRLHVESRTVPWAVSAADDPSEDEA